MVTTYYTSLMGAIITQCCRALRLAAGAPAQWGLFVLLALIANGGHYPDRQRL